MWKDNVARRFSAKFMRLILFPKLQVTSIIVENGKFFIQTLQKVYQKE